MGVFPWKYILLLFITARSFWDAFKCRFIWFQVNLRNFNPRKITFFGSFWYKNIFAQRCTTTWQYFFDAEFHGESYDVYPVTVAHCTKKFLMKNLEKVEKIMIIHEFSKKFQLFSALLGVCFHMNRLKIEYIGTEKTSKNPRNSAYAYLCKYS